jgi:hypothetical protein
VELSLQIELNTSCSRLTNSWGAVVGVHTTVILLTSSDGLQSDQVLTLIKKRNRLIRRTIKSKRSDGELGF